MFNDNADTSREIANHGRKQQKLRELYESIKLDILDESKFGANKTSYKLPPEFREDTDAIAEALESEGYVVVVEERDAKSVLKISWEE